eukprot:GFUD01045682.1.p1 GENE.GFUD01045682.1~~GFUD01045682.1.p1  ORF type:complete len:202 (+),score=44.52 GFUD01045682.1:55-660(+)
MNFINILRMKIPHNPVRQLNMASSLQSSSSPLQLTLAILKPDLVQHPPNLSQVHNMIIENEFFVVRSKIINLPRSRAEQFYVEHKEKFFYTRLVTFMSSGPCQPLILAKQEAIPAWRELMGPTKVFKTRYSHPDSIRGKYGLTDTRNCSHGSDSTDTARQEMEFFFPEFDKEQWEQEEKPMFEKGSLTFDSEHFVHSVTTR